MKRCAWVLGGSGLLGSALVRALRDDNHAIHQPATRFSWDQPDVAKAQLQREVDIFSDKLREFDHWTVFWAAGVGSMASQPESLLAEEHLLETLLAALADVLGKQAVPGTIVFASSAGALYGGLRSGCYTENSPVSSTTPYARHKLRQEELVRTYVTGAPSIGGLILRYSTLYGIGQSRAKPQGLITQLARKIVANEPAHIFVPLDTIRDYLHADDAARMTLDTLQDVLAQHGRTTVKIIAAERATSIAQLIGIFRRISDRKPRIVTSTNGLSSRYTHCAEFRSEIAAGKPHAAGRTLLVGIYQVFESERAIKVRSS